MDVFTDKPALSVVVVGLVGGDSLQHCLQALVTQANELWLEVLVPLDDRLAGNASIVRSFSFARIVPISGIRTYAELRSAGMNAATSPLVALTEDHCVPQADWCKKILEAHAAGQYGSVGGAIEKLMPDGVLGWAFYLADYARYMNPIPEGPSAHLSDCNVSYRRAALEPLHDLWRVEFHERIMHHALHEANETLWFAPQVIVQQRRTMTWRDALRDRFAFGRLFGYERSQFGSNLQRLIYAALSPLLPFLLVVRVICHVMERKRHRYALIRALPVLTVICTAWALGEFVGYLTGRPGDALSAQDAVVKEQANALS